MSQEDLPTFFDNATCTKKGLCPVTKLRKQDDDTLESHSLYYEIHGSGTKHKVVFIMGLNSSCFGWYGQVFHFSGKPDEYSVLVFDNRGVGNSGYPSGPYTTAGMAADVIALLDFVGWTGDREVDIVGISLGGMIAQEVATIIPSRISSLFLAVTTPGGRPWHNFPPWKGLMSLARLMVTPIPDRPKVVLPMLWPEPWLKEKSEEDPTKTNGDVQAESFLRRSMITRPQGLMGHVSQMCAGLTHHVSPARLAMISKSIPKITILTGDDDHLVSPVHSLELKAEMAEAELVQWSGTGHGIHAQWPRRFNELLERTFAEGKERRNQTEVASVL